MPTLISEVNIRLEEARKAYYAGEPIMSDAEYDLLEQQLAGMVNVQPGLFSQAPVLSTVGTDVAGRIPHVTPMLSIPNAYTIDDLCSWADALAWPTLTIGSKLDGVSDSLTYSNGPLVQALTRSDGLAGESVLPQILASKSIPSELPDYLSMEVRGEVVIEADTLRALNATLEAQGRRPYSTTRNLAAGTLKLHDPEEVARRKLLFRPWDVLFPAGTDAPDSAWQRLQDIVRYGFAPSDDRIVTNRSELLDALEELSATLQNPDQQIAKDGLVIKVDSVKLRKKIGHGSKFYNYAIAFKLQNQKAETTILSVQWQVGRQGKLTPVAIVDPVILGGVKVERSTLNNLTWIQNLGARIGSKVAIVRSGDVIPSITQTLDNPPASTEILPPTVCPSCGGPVEVRTEESSPTTTHRCNNTQCSGRLARMLYHIGQRTVLEIDTLGEELAAKLVEHKLVSDLADLFEFENDLKASIKGIGSKLTMAALEERGFSAVLTLRMIESLEQAKRAPWPRWVAAFSIPMTGRTLGKVLAKNLKLQPDDLPNLPAKLAAIEPGQIEGLGPEKLGELHRFATDPAWAELCARLYASGVRPTATVAPSADGSMPLKGVAFVITGEFDQFGSRDEITAKLESLGAVSKSGISKNVTHLLVGTSAGKSKLSKAEQLGIRQVGADWLASALAGTL